LKNGEKEKSHKGKGLGLRKGLRGRKKKGKEWSVKKGGLWKECELQDSVRD